ncbi:hypothetical protein CDD83_1643 [Cordyceps sp. RAO-2017]|nr:hypothetical protein CDD83_1643 [Cordyceps sp. RAO-2017]
MTDDGRRSCGLGTGKVCEEADEMEERRRRKRTGALAGGGKTCGSRPEYGGSAPLPALITVLWDCCPKGIGWIASVPGRFRRFTSGEDRLLHWIRLLECLMGRPYGGHGQERAIPQFNAVRSPNIGALGADEEGDRRGRVFRRMALKP